MNCVCCNPAENAHTICPECAARVLGDEPVTMTLEEARAIVAQYEETLHGVSS